MKKYAAEFFGAFALAFAVLLSLAGQSPLPTPVVAALTLGLFVYTIGHISGAHMNPAVTVGLWSIGKIRLQEAIGYIVAQLGGGALAYFLAYNGLNMNLSLAGGLNAAVFFAEALGTMLFAFGIASVAYGRAPSALSGIVVGGSLLLGIMVAAGIGSNGILNPAVALALKSANIIYALGPVLGAIAGFQLFKLLSGEETRRHAKAGAKKVA